MKYQNLANSNLKVSRICLGTMTFGEQNTEAEAFEQMDYALSQGVNFFDTAESYSVPLRPETYGDSERIIGKWLRQRKNRNQIILASKIAGRGAKEWVGHIRKGETIYNQETINQAIEGSLLRLNTDYLDLYQIHWPNRITNTFGKLNYPYQDNQKTDLAMDEDIILETIVAMNDLIQAGKIRHYGLSNETPWGMMKYLHHAKVNGLKPPISIQNIFNLVNRIYEISHAEVSQRENIALLAYSPLAFSILTGKYLTHTDTPHSRINLYPKYFGRFDAFKTNPILGQYLNLAKKHDLSLTQLALSFVASKGFVGSTIIGATRLEQLKENIDSIAINLSEAILSEIDVIHHQRPNPCL